MNTNTNTNTNLRRLVLLMIALTSFSSTAIAAGPRPNVIYIMADELGYYEPGFMGNPNIQTPNLDKMAAQGIIFRNMLAGSAVCAPTRCCFLTGKHSGHTSVRSNGGGTPLRAEEETIASILKKQGYATAGFGKWGCGGRDSTGVPEKHGFDQFLGYYDQVHAHTYFPPYLIRNSEEVPLTGNNGGSVGQTYSHYVIHDAAMSFIREHSQKPFFAYLPYTPPHGNFDIPDSDPAWAIYKDKPWPEAARRYAAMVTLVDRQVGAVLALLKELGIDQNTLVFFSGDNGANDYFKSAEHPRGVHLGNKNPKTGVEYRGTKGTLYEGGVRVPFIARWPGKIVPGSVSDYLGYFPDLLPTIAEATGATAPADVDGLSILPELIGEAAAGHKQVQHDYLYWEIGAWTAIRQGTWRAVRPKANQPWELYDLSTDPSESKDVAAAQPEILAKLTALAAKAHEPVREGTFSTTLRHERDRRAKFGKQDEPESPPKGNGKVGAVLRVTDPAAAADRTILAGSRPNIILIMPDDMGWGDIAAHGNPLIKTPHLDRLFAESTRFTDFHVSPTCSPTRSALMSGRHEFKNGVTHTINERERMSLKTTTLAQTLKSAGYTTGVFGKWHLGDEEPYQPQNRGFDEVFIHGAGGIGQSYVGSCGDAPNNKYFDPAIRHNGTFVKTKGYCTDVFFAQASQWIDAKRNEAKSPFFAYITPNAPHGPLISPGPQYDKLYEGKEIDGKKMAAGDVAYYSMISNVDENVGKLLAQLKDGGIENDTLVIFLCDNGGTHTRLFSGGFRAGKGSMYSGGTHAPSFWRWPGKLAAGRASSALTAHIDVLPTLAEIAGVKLNDAMQQQVEGRSLVPLLANPQADWPDRVLVTHVGRWEKGQAAQAKYKSSSIRDSRFRLVENKELFDLKDDFGETTNVIAEHPEVVVKLRAAYDGWWSEVQPLLVNEDAVGPQVNPYKELYWKQFGGGPKVETPSK